ncbi:MAG: chemotaxis protein CheW [Desulfobacteraceae bacterium]|nr:chemotaxis protein CheW [Desulfobacteraceae bacterium]
MDQYSAGTLPVKADDVTNDVIAAEGVKQFVTFYVGKHLFGLSIDNVIEINRCLNVTPVPLAPEYVSGIVNLRGHILTAVHLGRRIGLKEEGNVTDYNNVIIGKREEPLSLLVERIGDVIAVPKSEITPPPDLLAGIDVRFVKEVCKLPGRLLIILDCNAFESQGLSGQMARAQ